MQRENIIHRATDYFGILYYAFLALYSLYELFFGGEYVSILVIGPLFYAFAIYGILNLILIPIYAIGKLITKEKGVWGEIKGSFAMALWSLLCAVWIADEYLIPEARYPLVDLNSWALMLIVVVEILLRTLFFQRSQKDEKPNIAERLNQVSKAYPMGAITSIGILLGLIVVGLLYLPTDSQNMKSILLFSILILLPYLVLFEWINRRGGKAHHREYPSEEASTIEGKQRQQLLQTRTARLWPLWISLLEAILATFITYNLLNITMPQIPDKRLFILIFAGIYALLAWIRWTEIKGLGKEPSEAPA
jgi:hypothetical protein